MRIRSFAIFWLALFAVITAFSAVSVYLFDQFEPNWSKGISFQVLSWIAAVLAAVGTLGLAVGVSIFGGTERKLRVFGVGTAVGVVLLVQMSLGETLVSTTDGRQFFAALLAFGLSLLSAMLFRRGRRDHPDV